MQWRETDYRGHQYRNANKALYEQKDGLKGQQCAASKIIAHFRRQHTCLALTFCHPSSQV